MDTPRDVEADEDLDLDIDVGVEFRLQRHFDCARVFEFDGRVSVHRYEEDEDEEGVEVGIITGVFIPEVWSGAELLDLADIVSEDVYQLARVGWLADDGGDGLRLPEFTDCFRVGWVGVRLVEIDPTWRGRQLGYHAMRELTRWCASNQHTILVAKPHPTTSSGEPPPNEAAIGRIRRYWSRFGLRPIGETGIFGHGFELEWPEGSWMRTHDE